MAAGRLAFAFDDNLEPFGTQLVLSYPEFLHAHRALL